MNDLALWLIVLGPLAGAAAAGVLALAGRLERGAPLATLAGTAAGAVAALLANPASAEGTRSLVAPWLSIPPTFYISVGVTVDRLAWVMLGVVFTVSILVQIYSTGYMKGEAGYARYFAFLGLFTASMLGLVVADNLFQLYVCWELVGICSYLLIGFWWQKPSAANAAKKAFVVTRFGDVGFLLGVLLLVSVAGSFQYGEIERAVAEITAGAAGPAHFVAARTVIWLAPLLLLCGAIGKSAQFPLHIWLPDAMEGPTPVSALIHAATMVAAGVYMVARLMPVFAAAPAVMDLILVIGAITAFIAATIAVVQVDIKKVMAYSTISQLGYMMVGLGAAGEAAGVFHLTTHAMFKALLFLTAGTVIHALHHSRDPNDLRLMGGLGRRMPITSITCLVGVLALAGFPLLSGFWSKDAVLAAALERSSHSLAASAALWIGILVAGLTGFYSVRMWMMAFFGDPRSEEAERAHEAPLTMTAPLVVLAIPSLVLGWIFHQNQRMEAFLSGGTAAPETAPVWLPIVAGAGAVLGMGIAFALYRRPVLAEDPVERLPRPLYGFLSNLWGIDAFWNAVGARGALTAGRMVAWFDRSVVDGAMNGIGWLTGRMGAILRRTANGQTQSYAAALVAGTAAVALILVLYEGRASSSGGPAAARAPVLPAVRSFEPLRSSVRGPRFAAEDRQARGATR